MTVWIYTDADNTLWDTNAVFAEAQLALLEAAEALSGRHCVSDDRLGFVREFDQAIAARHHSRLRYPPALLLRALREGLNGHHAEEAAQRALAQGARPSESEETALAKYSEVLGQVPPTLPGVRNGLELARDHDAPVYVITEGPVEALRSRLRALELESLTAGSLSAAKTGELYARLKQRAAPHTAVMIGDQPDRDIRLAKEGGLSAILVRGPFRPRWIQSADSALANATVENFYEAVRWALDRAAPQLGAVKS